MNQYYARARPPALQFRSLARPERVEWLDAPLERYLVNVKRAYYHKAEDFFRLVLEESLIRSAEGKYVFAR